MYVWFLYGVDAVITIKTSSLHQPHNWTTPINFLLKFIPTLINMGFLSHAQSGEKNCTFCMIRSICTGQNIPC